MYTVIARQGVNGNHMELTEKGSADSLLSAIRLAKGIAKEHDGAIIKRSRATVMRMGMYKRWKGSGYTSRTWSPKLGRNL